MIGEVGNPSPSLLPEAGGRRRRRRRRRHLHGRYTLSVALTLTVAIAIELFFFIGVMHLPKLPSYVPHQYFSCF